MKKRVLAVLLSAAMVASLAVGCGSSSKSDEKSETKTETAKDTKEETKDVEAVEQRTVYVTPEWLKSAMDGNQKGYENVVVAEVATVIMQRIVSHIRKVTFQEQFMSVMLK